MNERRALPPTAGSQTHLVHTAMRLLRIIRHRRIQVVSCLLAAALLGALYYCTAAPLYSARVSLMMTYQGGEDSLTGTDTYRRGMLPTYERLFYSSVVLEQAAARIEELPSRLRVDVNPKPRDEWVETLRKNLTARAVRSTNFIEVSYRSHDDEAAVAVLESVVDAYLNFIDLNQKNVATEIVRILHKGRSEVASQLDVKEQELLTAQRETGDLGIRNGSTITHPLVHNVVRINEALVDVRKQRMQLDASLAAVRNAIAHGQDVRQFMLSMEDAGGREMALGMLGMSEKDEEFAKQLKRELNVDYARLESIQDFYGSNHPTLIELQKSILKKEEYLSEHGTEGAQIDAIQNQQLGQMLLASIQGKLTTAIAHEQNLEREFRIAQSQAVEVNGKVARVAIIEHDLKMLRELHDTLRNRIANLDIRQDQTEVRMAVVSAAKSSDSPVHPKLTTVASSVLLFGLSLGIGLAYVLDVLDDRFRSIDELKEQLNVAVLAIVRQLTPTTATGIESLQVHTAPNDVASESFRTLRSTLAFSEQGGECVAISSSEPGDGKTTVLSNLGASSAQAGKRTLLVDADMRRPGLTRLFGFRGKGGLSDILTKQEEVQTVCEARIQKTSLQGLDVLPAGPLPTDPSGLLTNSRFSEFIAWACDSYDQVLIDTPPILAASDASIVSRLTGGLVLIIQPTKNHRRLVHRAVDEIRAANLDLTGVVINRIATDGDSAYGYSYGYGQGYGHGYHEDTHEEESPATLPIHDRQAFQQPADGDSERRRRAA